VHPADLGCGQRRLRAPLVLLAGIVAAGGGLHALFVIAAKEARDAPLFLLKQFREADAVRV
jgi:hypothetical protein